MRVLSFNLWHGLSPKSPFAMEALEPVGRRVRRERLQIDVLRSTAPDIGFFQEVNPVGPRTSYIAEQLGLAFEFQPDLVGTKLFGVGLPLNLHSGLSILGQKSFGLKWVDAVSLSRPGIRLVRNWASWQLSEERFALFCEAMVPNWGRVLLVNTHLHHGLEGTPEFMDKVYALADQLEFSPSLISDLKERIARGSRRREQEMNRLMSALTVLEPRYEVVLIAGDFNASPGSVLFDRLREAGFRDAWMEASPEDGGFTYDQTKNRANHILQDKFPVPLMVEDLSFSQTVKEALLQIGKEQDGRPRRIDYIWYRSNSNLLKVKDAALVGFPDEDGFAPSDHFGVCVDFQLA
jgi:endonuclease/exonuclease/phosphatase family metal-dependent hydrolase